MFNLPFLLYAVTYVFHMISVIRRPLYTHRPEFVIYETFLSPCTIKPETTANQLVGTILYLPVLSQFFKLIKKYPLQLCAHCLIVFYNTKKKKKTEVGIYEASWIPAQCYPRIIAFTVNFSVAMGIPCQLV